MLLYILSLLIALILDMVFGDPEWEYHPVALIGKLAKFLEPICRKFSFTPAVNGLFFLLLNIVIPLFLIKVVRFLLPGSLFGFLINTSLLYFALGGTCLAHEVKEVGRALAVSLAEGRLRLRRIVSRGVDKMDESEVLSGAIETLAENFNDAVVGMLFWATLVGPTFAWLYRIVNTLDAMVGYKTEEYKEFGRATARLDDILNYPSARLSAFIVAIVSSFTGGSWSMVMKTVASDARKLESPNSGLPIAAFAGALSLRLCGPAYYFGTIKEKPYIGAGKIPTAADLNRALKLYWHSYHLAAAAALIISFLVMLVVKMIVAYLLLSLARQFIMFFL